MTYNVCPAVPGAAGCARKGGPVTETPTGPRTAALTAEFAHLVADIVVERLRGEPPTRYLTSEQVAGMLAASPDWVRRNRAELRATRLGGENGPLRFNIRHVQQWMDSRALKPDPPASEARRRGRPRKSRGVDLIPIPDEVKDW